MNRQRAGGQSAYFGFTDGLVYVGCAVKSIYAVNLRRSFRQENESPGK